MRTGLPRAYLLESVGSRAPFPNRQTAHPFSARARARRSADGLACQRSGQTHLGALARNLGSDFPLHASIDSIRSTPGAPPDPASGLPDTGPNDGSGPTTTVADPKERAKLQVRQEISPEGGQ